MHYYAGRISFSLGPAARRRGAELCATALSLSEKLSSFECDALRPILARCLAWLGRWHFNAKETEKAIKLWREALDRSPDLSRVGMKLADELLRLDRLDTCASLLRDASERGETWPLQRLAMLHFRRGEYNDAVLAFQKLLRGDVDKPTKGNSDEPKVTPNSYSPLHTDFLERISVNFL